MYIFKLQSRENLGLCLAVKPLKVWRKVQELRSKISWDCLLFFTSTQYCIFPCFIVISYLSWDYPFKVVREQKTDQNSYLYSITISETPWTVGCGLVGLLQAEGGKGGVVERRVVRKMMMDLWASKAMLQPEEDTQVVMKTSLRELVLYWSV